MGERLTVDQKAAGSNPALRSLFAQKESMDEREAADIKAIEAIKEAHTIEGEPAYDEEFDDYCGNCRACGANAEVFKFGSTWICTVGAVESMAIEGEFREQQKQQH